MTASDPSNNPFAAFIALPQAIAKAQIAFATNATQAWLRLLQNGVAMPAPAAIAEAVAEMGLHVDKELTPETSDATSPAEARMAEPVVPKPAPPRPDKAAAAVAPALVPESALSFDDAFVTPRMPPLLNAPDGTADDFTAIKGIGPKLSKLLNELGVHHYRQVAAWTPEEIAWINDKLDFKGRVQREKWVQQARTLAGLA